MLSLLRPVIAGPVAVALILLAQNFHFGPELPGAAIKTPAHSNAVNALLFVLIGTTPFNTDCPCRHRV